MARTNADPSLENAVADSQDGRFDMLSLQLGFTYASGSDSVFDDRTPVVELAEPVHQ